MKFLKLSSCTLLVLTLFSCKKLLDIPERNFIGGDVALTTVQNAESAIIGAYTQMNPEMAILLNAVFSDELRTSEFYNAQTVHEWQFGSVDVGLRDNYNALNVLYRGIDRANRVLARIDVVTGITPADETIRSLVKGEALFIRAFNHFELTRYYSGNYDPNGLALTYVETPSLNKMVREPMGPYFIKIIADINAAKALLPNNLADKFRANRLAAVGLHARVALYMRDWVTATAQSTEFITALPLSPRAQFPGLWTDQNANETAFLLARTAAIGGRIGGLFRGTSVIAGTSINIGTITWAPSEKLWSSYDQQNDIRFPTYFKDEPILTATNRPSRLIAKYAGAGYTSPNENVAHAKIFRTGEMILIRAEARAENNDLAAAAADVNALRTARITGSTNISYPSKEAAIDGILLARFRELAYEGHRFWDLKRKNKPVERLAIDVPSAAAGTLAAGNSRFTLPIPFSELQANPLYVQNPGY